VRRHDNGTVPRHHPKRSWIVAAAVVPLLVLGLVGALLLANLGVWYRAQYGLEDWVQRATASGEPDPRVVIVAIDDASLDRQRRHWPWPRGLVARLIEEIAGARPRVIGVDLLFTTPVASDPDGDAALAAAVSKAGRIVLLEKVTFSRREGETAGVALPLASLVEHASTGYFNLSLDSDRVFRRQRLVQQVAGEQRHAFAHQLYLEWTGRGATPPDPPVRRVRFRGPPGTFLHVSADDVLNRRVPAATFRDRIVLVGATFSDAKDGQPTPVTTGANTMHGVEIHANVLSNLLTGDQIRETSARVNHLACLLLIAAIAAVTAFRSRRGGALLAGAALVGSALLYGTLLVAADLAIPLVPLWIATLVAYGAGHPSHGLVHRQRPETRNVLKLTAPDAASVDPASGEQAMTLCAIEIENLASVAQSLVKRDLGRYLQAYFAGVGTIIERHGGVLGEELSPGLVALFGLDTRQVDHAARACRAALDLMQTVGQMEQQWQREAGVTFQTRVGIHTTRVSLTASGAAGRRELTVAGHDLDVPSRLAGLAKRHGASVVASDQTARLLSEGFRLQAVGEIRLRGQRQPAPVHGVLGETTQAPTLLQIP
jgi:adenylate cyclase